ncbi:DNA polymerase clamp loader subunit A [Methanohalobium sp.]|uniref:DNA polymerase clamp loader subunit A n=1 Tax=Methanohalobium sp. TaxID=2837493 RepID=UPI0025D6CD91|nr:DNA polymerase clamp loader subunit A [Methanohalobium sp.]
MTKINPFDFINDINSAKKNIMRGTDNDDLMEKSYVPYITNKQLSYFQDTLHHANQMNMNADIPHVMQYEYLLNVIRPRKRYTKWEKPINDEVVDMLMEYYNCNREKAIQFSKIITESDVEKLRQKLLKGGE